jgi:hypothetical protein
VGITVTIQFYRLAALPVEHLRRQETLLAWLEVGERTLDSYREVFVTGVRAYQQYTYLELVGWTYGRAVAHEVEVLQRRLLEFTTGSGNGTGQALSLIESALETLPVSAATRSGEIAIPIEMNVALALLLGLPESPDYVSTAAQRFEQIARMQPEIDWCLAHCLTRAREEIKNVFLPAFPRLVETAGDSTACD